MRLRAPLAAAAALLLAGCGRAPPEALFPLEEGRRWRYLLTTSYEDGSLEPREETLELANRGAAPLAGAPAWKRVSSSGIAYWLRQDASGVYRVAVQGPLDAAPRMDAAARYVLKQPLAVGTEWAADTTSYVLVRRNEYPRELRNLPRYRVLPMRYRIAALDEEVETRAGRFSGCVRVDAAGEIHLYVDEQMSYRDVPFTTREWYCPRVGLVKLERVERSPTRFLAGGVLRMELAGYE